VVALDRRFQWRTDTEVRLNVVSSRSDARILDVIERKQLASSRVDLERILTEDELPTTLDLTGHSVDGMLELGDWVIDESALPWFRFHATALRRFERVRLIGCHTAASLDARRMISSIADVLGVEVYGAMGFIFHYHYTAEGFDPAWEFLLTSASELRYRDDEQRNPMS